MKARLELVRIFTALSHPLTNFEIQKYYQHKTKFNGAYLRNDLPKIKNEAYVINLDMYKSVGTHWIALYVNNNNVTFFGSFGVEHIPKKLKNSLATKILKQIFIGYKQMTL